MEGRDYMGYYQKQLIQALKLSPGFGVTEDDGGISCPKFNKNPEKTFSNAKNRHSSIHILL
jgi:hypothetical protein